MERCARCGEELRPDANFCHQCGARVVRERAAGDEWEYCEVVARPRWIGSILPKRYIEVAVEGTGPDGPYRTSVQDGCIRKEYGDLGDEGKEAVEAAVHMLLASDWELTPEHGGAWWSYRFRHAVRQAVFMQPDTPGSGVIPVRGTEGAGEGAGGG